MFDWSSVCPGSLGGSDLLGACLTDWLKYYPAYTPSTSVHLWPKEERETKFLGLDPICFLSIPNWNSTLKHDYVGWRHEISITEAWGCFIWTSLISQHFPVFQYAKYLCTVEGSNNALLFWILDVLDNKTLMSI